MNANKIIDNILCQTKSSEKIKIIKLDITAPNFLLNLTPENKKESLTPLTSEEIDSESLYNSIFEEKKHYKTSNWASGITTHEFYRQKESTLFFEYLFETVSGNTPAELSRSNLFHGHIVYNEDLNDILIVFHAFEYPSDIEDIKSNLAYHLEKKKKFISSDKGFQWRNSFYSRNKNSLFIIENSLENISPLIYENITLDQSFFGKGIFDINYFPSEGIRPFLH